MAAGLVACGEDSETSQAVGGTVPHVGELPRLQTGRDADGRPVTAATSDVVPASVPGTTNTTTASTDDGTVPVTSADSTATTAGDTAGSASTASTDASVPGSGAPSTISPLDGVLGATASGNRILALGDSITAAIGPQFGGQLCDALEDQGWYLGVDAVQGRALDAGLDDLDGDIDIDDWDAAIVNLGANYRGDAEQYDRELEQVLDILDGRPTILVTVSEFQEDIAEVNYVIRDVAKDRDDVWVLEWSEVTADDDSLTGSDRLHLSEDGRALLADLLAEAVGDAPAGSAAPDCARLRNALPASSPNDAADDGSD